MIVRQLMPTMDVFRRTCYSLEYAKRVQNPYGLQTGPAKGNITVTE